MMKKILLILLVLLMSVGTISAQEMDMATILAMLDDPEALANTDITEFQALLSNTDTVDENGDPLFTDEDGNQLLNTDGTAMSVGDQIMAEIDEVIEDLVADGSITEEMATTTTAVVEAIEAGQTDDTGTITLGAALDQSDTSLDDISNSIAEAIAVMAVSQLTSDPEMKASLVEGVGMLKGLLGTLSKFGQANSQTSMANSLYGHQGYNLFALSLGVTGSFASDMTTVDSVIALMDSADKEALLTKQLKDGGFNAGVSLQAISANIGINFSWLVDGLYLGAVFGSTNATINSEGFGVQILGQDVYNQSMDIDVIDTYALSGSVNTSIYGITANYQLVKNAGIPILFRWNGLSLGTGVIYSGFSVDMKADLSQMLTTMSTPEGSTEPAMEIEAGSFIGAFGISSNAITVPLEISTGVRVLSIVNISLGAGADLKFGSSNVTFDLEGEKLDTIGGKIMESLMNGILEMGDMSFPYDNPGAVEILNLKAMVGVGIGLGPISLDFNFTGFVSPNMEEIGLVIGANAVLRI